MFRTSVICQNEKDLVSTHSQKPSLLIKFDILVDISSWQFMFMSIPSTVMTPLTVVIRMKGFDKYSRTQRAEDSSPGRIQAAPLSWLNFVTSHSSWEALKIKSSKTNRWIIIVTYYQTWAGKLHFFDTWFKNSGGNVWKHGWKHSRWEFTAWEFSGREFSKGEFDGCEFSGWEFSWYHSLQIISRNHSNTILLINSHKIKTQPK